MALIRTLTISTTTFERTKEKFYGFRQTVLFEREWPKLKKFSGVHCTKLKSYTLLFTLDLVNYHWIFLIGVTSVNEKWRCLTIIGKKLTTKSDFCGISIEFTVNWKKHITYTDEVAFIERQLYTFLPLCKYCRLKMWILCWYIALPARTTNKICPKHLKQFQIGGTVPSAFYEYKLYCFSLYALFVMLMLTPTAY